MKNGIVYITLVALILIGLSSCQKGEKVGYVDAYQLFENFNGQKEVKAKFVSYEKEVQAQIDTLSYQRVARDENGNPSQSAIYAKQLSVQNLQEDLNTKQFEYTAQVWEQINTYIAEFGEEEQYDFILSGTGDGTIMYRDASQDITDEVVDYINAKYEGH